MNKIILTSDADTYKKLLDEGFNYLGKNGKYYQFANVGTLTFSDDIDQSTITYTNKLCV